MSRDGSWANGFGLHDMIGNVREWTADGGRKLRVLRGGSWFNFPNLCRAADRDDYAPGRRLDDIGFRVCRGSPIETRDAATLGTEAPSR